MVQQRIKYSCYGLILLLLAWLPAAAVATDGKPLIAIIIDDMGNQLAEGRRALELQGAVTYAFLPHTPYARRLANKAHVLGREVMLHLPMDAHGGNRLGPGALSLHMTEGKLQETLKSSLASVPHVAGVNNHMGSLLTRHPGAMQWLMQGLREYGSLYFIDSRTSPVTVAEKVALEYDLPTASRDVFLDHVREPEAIRLQFRRLIQIALRHGKAIGIGHPYQVTREILSQELAQLDAYGVQLVPVSRLLTDEVTAPTLLVEPVKPAAPATPRLGAVTESGKEKTEVDL
jgi:polysaccharide deacetylase 2 family uncharacterized protein YibQ